MIITPLLKSVTALFLSLAATPDCTAQVASWYQQYSPQYYYGYNPNYQYPAYGYQPQPQRAAEPAPSKQVKKKAEKREKMTKPDNDRWLTDFNTAWARAVEQGKPLVVIFVHHGCPECDRMDATLAQPGARQILDSAVKARIEFAQNPATVRRFGIKLTPTFLVLSPAHNGEVYREVGALSLDRLRQLKPSIDGLVTAPASNSDREQADDSGRASNEETSVESEEAKS